MGMQCAYTATVLPPSTGQTHLNVVSPGPTETEMMHKLMADHPDLKNLAAGNLDSSTPAVQGEAV